MLHSDAPTDNKLSHDDELPLNDGLDDDRGKRCELATEDDDLSLVLLSGVILQQTIYNWVLVAFTHNANYSATATPIPTVEFDHIIKFFQSIHEKLS